MRRARREPEPRSATSPPSTSSRAGRIAGASFTTASGSGRSGSARRGSSRRRAPRSSSSSPAARSAPARIRRRGSASSCSPSCRASSLLDVGCGSGVLAIAGAKLGFAPVHAVDHDPVAVETTTANAAANGVDVDVRVSRRACRRAAGRGHDGREPHARGRPRARAAHRLLVTSSRRATSRAISCGCPAERALRRATLDGWAADVWELARGVTFRPMATFSVGFLGCKVSHVDAHAVRERLLADGHSERAGGADVAVVSTCCVTHEAVSKSRKAVSRLARTHGRVYVTGCAANLPENAFAGLADNVVVVREAERGDACGGCRRRRRDRVRPGGSSPRSRPRLRQGAGRLQLLVCVLRDPAGAGSFAEPPGRRRAARDRAPRAIRAIARSSSPASTSAATGIARLATTCRGSCARPAPRPVWRGSASRRSR